MWIRGKWLLEFFFCQEKKRLLKESLNKIYVIKNTSLEAIRSNYPLKEVRTSHVSLSGLL